MSDGVGRVAVYVGIDPGLDGAVAVVCAGGGLLDWCDTPTLEVERRGARRREYADAMMARVLGCVAERWMVAGVALEHVHSMPAQGVRSSFTFGVGVGLWRGIIAGLGLPLSLVAPQRWRGALLDGMGRDKDASRLRALQLWPTSVDVFRRRRDDGRADAALMAEWLRRSGGAVVAGDSTPK